jgi:hypothetical protein
VGSSTFDANNGRYIVNAFDTVWTQRLCIIDAATGNILSKEIIDLPAGGSIVNLEYNNEDNKVYGLFRSNDNTFQAIASLDLDNENQMDTIYEFDDLKYFIQGSAVLHQASQTYILFYVDDNDQSRLAHIDITNGTRPANPAINDFITEIEVDNTEYALAKYHELVGETETKQPERSFTPYPNPVSTVLRIDLKEAAADLRLIGLNGQTVYRQQDVAPGKFSLAVERFSPGLYNLIITTESGRETAQVIIQ